MSKLYVAYGSNLSEEQMSRRCPGARVVSRGELLNHRLVFRGSPFSAVASVEPKDGVNVPVLIWSITPEDERALDQYEGFPNLYIKHWLRVKPTAGPLDIIMTYVLNPARQLPLAAPNASYFGIILDAYHDLGFPVPFLNASLKHRGRRF